MASYYYLISSLPMLRAGDAPPLDYAAFLDQCQGAVSDRVYRSLEELTVRSEDGGFVSRWAAFYRVQLRVLPVFSSISNRQPSSTQGPSGLVKRTGRPVRIFSMAAWGLTPSTLCWGPVMPRSVM